MCVQPGPSALGHAADVEGNVRAMLATFESGRPAGRRGEVVDLEYSRHVR
jgi:hypothetical protein